MSYALRPSSLVPRGFVVDDAAVDGEVMLITVRPASTASPWAREAATGQLRLNDLVDMSQAVDAEARTDPERHAREAVGSLTEDEDARPAADSQLATVLADRLDELGLLAVEIAGLNQKRITAASRGRDLAEEVRIRLQQLVSSFAVAVVALPLRPDRVSQLVEILEDEQKTLRYDEGESARLGRVGLPASEFRHVAADIRKAWRELEAIRIAFYRHDPPLGVTDLDTQPPRQE